MKLGASSLFTTAKSFRNFIKYVERDREIKVWEVVDEAGTELNKTKLSLLKDLARVKGLEIILHAPFLDVNIASLSPYMRNASLKHLEASLTKAYFLECKTWTIHGGLYPSVKLKERSYELSLSSLSKLALKAMDYGIKIAVENGPPGLNYLYVEACEALSQLSKLSHLEAVRLCLDVGHAYLAGELDSFLCRADGLLICVHVHDNDGREDLHLPLGEGSVNWNHVLSKLENLQFKGYIIIETLTEPLLSVKFFEEMLSVRGKGFNKST